MVITEEIIAAYIEGKLSKEERTKVLRYLAKNPHMQDVVLVMMDDCDYVETKQINAKNVQMQVGQSLPESTFAAAAFVPQKKDHQQHRNFSETEIHKRQNNILSFMNEIEKR